LLVRWAEPSKRLKGNRKVTMEKKLDEIRDAIDSFDKQLVELFEQRMAKAIEALRLKQETGIPVLQHGREQKVLEKVKGNLKNKQISQELEELYVTIMKLSRQIQAREWSLSDFLLIGESIVLPLGEKKENSHILQYDPSGEIAGQDLTKQFKADNENIQNSSSLEEIFIAVKNNDADYGIIPIEDSTTGSFKTIYELLIKYELYIVEEKYLEKNPQINEMICEGNDWLRYIRVGKKLEVTNHNKKISVVYSLRHNVGSLHETLGILAKYGINLAKIESRPVLNQTWKNNFYVEIEGNLLDDQVQKALKEIQEKTLFIKILGNY